MIGQSMLPAVIPQKPPALVPQLIPSAGGGDSDTFSKKFLSLMERAGTILGLAAAKAINENARVMVGFQGSPGGSQQPSPVPVDPLSGRKRFFGNALRMALPNGMVNMLQSTGLFGRLASSLSTAGARGLVGAGAAVAPFAAFKLGSMAFGAAEGQAMSQRRLAQFSAPVAQNFAQSDMRRMFREMRQGAAISDSNRALLNSLDAMKDRLATFAAAGTNVVNKLLTPMLDKMTNILEWVEWFFGFEKKPAPENPWVKRFQQLADAADPKNKRRQPVPRAVNPPPNAANPGRRP